MTQLKGFSPCEPSLSTKIYIFGDKSAIALRYFLLMKLKL